MFQNLPSYTGRRGIDLGRGSKIDRPGMVAIFNAGLRDRRAQPDLSRAATASSSLRATFSRTCSTSLRACPALAWRRASVSARSCSRPARPSNTPRRRRPGPPARPPSSRGYALSMNQACSSSPVACAAWACSAPGLVMEFAGHSTNVFPFLMLSFDQSGWRLVKWHAALTCSGSSRSKLARAHMVDVPPVAPQFPRVIPSANWRSRCSELGDRATSSRTAKPERWLFLTAMYNRRRSA